MYYLCSNNLNEIHTLKTDKPFFYRLKRENFDVRITTSWQHQNIFCRNNVPCLIRWILLILFGKIHFYNEEVLRRMKFLFPLIYTFFPNKVPIAIAIPTRS